MIGILDLGMGNLRSVSNALHGQGFDCRVVRDARELEHGITHLVVPGVGAYAAAAQSLDRQGLRRPVLDFAASGRPTLGICLGMELLSDLGEEGGPARGLGLVSGRVVRLRGGEGFAVPHVGWNNVEIKTAHPLLDRVKNGVDFYFVHSYRFACASDADVIGLTEYGEPFASIVGRGNVAGLQFHPEKSQANGLRLLSNFCEWDGRC